ncbi:MAG: universal stress protein [Candidatus Obscuribacterales bacterium]
MHVVIAINEAKYAEAIANFVINHDWKDDTTFEVISIVKPMKIGTFEAVLPGPILDEIVQKKTKAAESLVQTFLQSITKTIDQARIKTSVREGFPADEIMETLKASHADILIVGSHARHGIERAFLGSVSHYLVFHAECSIIVIRLPNHQ